MTRTDHEINSELKKVMPDMAKLFDGTAWERIPNAPSDAGKSLEVYAAQAGDVTLLACKPPIIFGFWYFKKVIW